MEYIVILIGGFIIGIIGVIFGGSMFLSLPFWQTMFPTISYGQVVGNIKVGSFFRGFASTLSTWKKINLKQNLIIIIPFVVSSIIGTMAIAKLDQNFLIYGVVGAIILSEISPKLAHLVNNKTRIIFAILLGLYTGFIGAGISILLVALLRTIFPKNNQIVFVKIQARFIETTASLFVIMAHIYYGNIIFPLWLLWAGGMFAGGYLGGHILKKTLHISEKAQRIYLIIVYLIALLPFLIKFLSN
ncbi:TSUP family transporter [Patescibacteria group bacterium]